MKKFFKEYGLYNLAIFFIIGWIQYDLFNLNGIFFFIVLVLAFMTVTCFTPYLILYGNVSQTKEFIDKIIKSDKAKKITYYVISIALNYYVISILIETNNRYNP